MNRRAMVISLILIVLFLFTRLYKLDSSLLFFNDMGRDFLELLEWQETGLPPLLGPQTSAFSFNQSAVYYYLLYPAYLLSGQSPFASVYAVIAWYLFWFLFGLYHLRHRPDQLRVLWLASLLLIFQPEIMRQTRFIWNPSFTPPLLLAALFAYQSLYRQSSPKASWLFAAVSALAIGLTLASVPIVAALLTFLVLKQRRKALSPVIYTFICTALVFSPALVFELRHHFTLTYLLHGQTLPQPALTMVEKITKLNAFILQTPAQTIPLALFFLGMLLFKPIGNKTAKTPFAVLLLVTLLIPVSIESHYIFPLTLTLIYLIANLPLKFALAISTALIAVWLQSPTFQAQFNPARRTISQLQACYREFCRQYQDPLYVSMQSGLLPYHNAPEHRYFMKTAGCQVLDIEKSQNGSKTMAVVVDDSTYEHGQTAYNELTLFGPSAVADQITCRENLAIYVLKKKLPSD
jgi:hypothetical protein